MKKICYLALFCFFISTLLIAQEKKNLDEDKTGIKEAALNYIEGWYEGNAERMEKALHPELAKRNMQIDSKSNRCYLDQMSAMTLINATRKGYGKRTPENEQQKDVIILDIFGNTASAKIIARDWVDYIHLVKWNGEWKILNVLWELKK